MPQKNANEKTIRTTRDLNITLGTFHNSQHLLNASLALRLLKVATFDNKGFDLDRFLSSPFESQSHLFVNFLVLFDTLLMPG